MASQIINFCSMKKSSDHGDVMEISPQEVWSKHEELVIVDVRRPDEFEGELGHIPGARLIVLDTLPQRIGEIPTDRTVVFVCRSGGRSGRATAFARQNGLGQALNMTGGMIEWNNLNLPVEGRSE